MNTIKTSLVLAAVVAAMIGAAAHAQTSTKTGNFALVGQSAGDSYTTVSNGDWNAYLNRERDRFHEQVTRNRSDEEPAAGPAD